MCAAILYYFMCVAVPVTARLKGRCVEVAVVREFVALRSVRPTLYNNNRILLDVSMIVFGIIIIVTRPRDRISRVFYYKRFVLCSYIIITLHDEASVSWAYTRCRTSFRSAVGGGFCV